MSLIFAALLLAPVTPPAPNVPTEAIANHLSVHVANPERSVEFYIRHFGLERLPTGSTTSTTRWLRAGSFELHLVGGRTATVSTPRQLHLALRVNDLVAVTAGLDADRVQWGDLAGAQRVVQTRADGVRQIYLQDPDGYWVEVNQAP